MLHSKALSSLLIIAVTTSASCLAFTSSGLATRSKTTALNGLFDNWSAGGSGNRKEDLDDQWKKQQEILKFRRSSNENKQKYFESVSVVFVLFIQVCNSRSGHLSSPFARSRITTSYLRPTLSF